MVLRSEDSRGADGPALGEILGRALQRVVGVNLCRRGDRANFREPGTRTVGRSDRPSGSLDWDRGGVPTLRSAFSNWISR